MPDMLKTREALQRLKAEGMPISEYTLRRIIKSGEIPVRQVGSTVLIYYPNLVRYLTCEDGCDNQPATVIPSGIRRVNL